MKQTLKIATQEHLSSKRLSSRQMQSLLELQNNNVVTNTQVFWYKTVSVASILVLSVLSVYLLNSSFFSTQKIEQRIAEEVAGNHLKLKPLEVKGNTIQSISSYFKLLNFSPVNPLSFTLTKQNLLGGRYCSIQGVTALQLRMMNQKTNKMQTLYETDYDKQVFKGFPKTDQGGNPLTLYVKGMKVDMWVEKDILFALIE